MKHPFPEYIVPQIGNFLFDYDRIKRFSAPVRKIVGCPRCPGLYSNDFIFSYCGKSLTNRYVFSVKSNISEKGIRSLLHPLENLVMHDCQAGRNFKYSAKVCHDIMAEKAELAIGSDSQVSWKMPLPEGLAGNMEEDDYVVSGTPLKAGTFTNWLEVAREGNKFQSMHVFRIENLGNPPMLKGLSPTLDRKSDCFWRRPRSYSDKYVKWEETYVGQPLLSDWSGMLFAIPEISYSKYREPERAEFIDPVDKSLGWSEMSDGYRVLPTAAGYFTNHVMVVFDGHAYTNLHIYVVHK